MSYGKDYAHRYVAYSFHQFQNSKKGHLLSLYMVAVVFRKCDWNGLLFDFFAGRLSIYALVCILIAN